MNKTENQTRTVFSVLQVLTVLAGALWLAAACGALFFSGEWLFFNWMFDNHAMVKLFATLIGLSAGLGALTAGWWGLRALWTFFRMCGRLKSYRAFTVENGESLRCISRLTGMCGGVCAATPVLMDLFTLILRHVALSGGAKWEGLVWTGELAGVFVLAFLFGGVSLACEALRQLLVHAMALEEENEGTV